MKVTPKIFSKQKTQKMMTYLMNSKIKKPEPFKAVKVGKTQVGISENDVKREIEFSLKSVHEVFWFTRLNSGRIETKWRTWVKLCDEGTPDFIALMSVGGKIYVLFIEAKRPGGYQREMQKLFQDNVSGIKNVFYILASSMIEVNNIIRGIREED